MTVQNGACGDECRPEQEWPPFVTTTMELDETKGACQLYSWQVAHVRFISDHVAPHDHDDKFKTVCVAVNVGQIQTTCTPTCTDHNGRPSTESRAHAQGG